MKKLYTLLSLLGLVSLSTAQSFQWLGNGGGNNTLDNEVQENVIDLKTDSQRNVYLLSYVSRFGASVAGTPVTTYDAGGGGDNQDFILVSYSCAGAYRWHKVFWGGGYDVPSGLVIDSQDNVYVTGYVYECGPSGGLYYSEARIGDNNGVDYSFGNTPTSCRQTFLTKFTSTGVFQWIHFPYIHMALSSFPPFPSRFLHIVNDEIYWAIKLPPGSYEGGQVVNSDTTVPYREYLLKYNTAGVFTGSVLFDIKINTSNGFPDNELRWYRNPYNGNYYVRYDNSGGQSTETLTVGGTAINAFLPKIICFNAQGQYLWHREVSESGILLSALAFSSQHVFLTGSANTFQASSSFLGWSSTGISGFGTMSFIMKCPQDMSSYEWITYNNTFGGLTDILHYAPNTDVLYSAGHIGSNPFVWGSQSIAGPGTNNGADPLLARFNTTTGACTSLVRIPSTNGYMDKITSITQDAAGDLVVGGYMGLNLTVNGTTYTYNGGNTDYFVAKYANQPCQPLALDQTDLSNLVYTYPNPAQNTVTLQNLPITCNYTIHNLLGQTLQTGTLTPTQNQLTLQSLPQGYYNLLLTQNGAVIYKTIVIKN